MRLYSPLVNCPRDSAYSKISPIHLCQHGPLSCPEFGVPKIIVLRNLNEKTFVNYLFLPLESLLDLNSNSCVNSFQYWYVMDQDKLVAHAGQKPSAPKSDLPPPLPSTNGHDFSYPEINRSLQVRSMVAPQNIASGLFQSPMNSSTHSANNSLGTNFSIAPPPIVTHSFPSQSLGSHSFPPHSFPAHSAPHLAPAHLAGPGPFLPYQLQVHAPTLAGPNIVPQTFNYPSQTSGLFTSAVIGEPLTRPGELAFKLSHSSTGLGRSSLHSKSSIHTVRSASLLPNYSAVDPSNGNINISSYPRNNDLSYESRDPDTSISSIKASMGAINHHQRAQFSISNPPLNFQQYLSPLPNFSDISMSIVPNQDSGYGHLLVEKLPSEMKNQATLPLKTLNSSSSRDINFVFVTEKHPSTSEVGENVNHEKGIDTNQRTTRSFADDMEHHLHSLIPLAVSCTFNDLAQRMKAMSPSDPIFGSLNNKVDMRHDRHRHLFALAWLGKRCEVSFTTVITRTRVYAHYVDTCNTHGLAPLMPTNFGKLVRSMFPNLTIRRLGMRGKSKYYYCGIKLSGEMELSSPLNSPTVSDTESSRSDNGETETLTGSQPLTPNDFRKLNDTFQKIELQYVPGLFSKIDSEVQSGVMNYQPLDIPPIFSYLPENYEANYAMAESLQTSYRNHLTSCFELIRYLKPEKLFDLYASLISDVGSGFNLLVDVNTANWVKDCDLAMFRSAIKMLARLHIQNLPTHILDPLKSLVKNYYSRILEALKPHFPSQFVCLKLNLIKQFMRLLSRLLFCNESTVHVSAILENSPEKAVMLNDWLSLDIPDILMRELPCKNSVIELLIEILDTRLVELLEEPNSGRGPVVAKYSQFLFELPESFPHVTPWSFLLVASNILTTCIREMTLAGSRSFKSWWVLRCWVDEFIKWFLELGGYLYDDNKPPVQLDVKSESIEGLSSLQLEMPHNATNSNNSNLIDFLDLFENGDF